MASVQSRTLALDVYGRRNGQNATLSIETLTHFGRLPTNKSWLTQMLYHFARLPSHDNDSVSMQSWKSFNNNNLWTTLGQVCERLANDKNNCKIHPSNTVTIVTWMYSSVDIYRYPRPSEKSENKKRMRCLWKSVDQPRRPCQKRLDWVVSRMSTRIYVSIPNGFILLLGHKYL